MSYIINGIYLMIGQLLKLFKTDSLKNLILIFIVFSITGIISLYVSDVLIGFISKFISSELIKIVIRVFSLFFLYQLLLLLVAVPFGQFAYFITYQTRFVRKIKSLF